MRVCAQTCRWSSEGASCFTRLGSQALQASELSPCTLQVQACSGTLFLVPTVVLQLIGPILINPMHGFPQAKHKVVPRLNTFGQGLIEPLAQDLPSIFNGIEILGRHRVALHVRKANPLQSVKRLLGANGFLVVLDQEVAIADPTLEFSSTNREYSSLFMTVPSSKTSMCRTPSAKTPHIRTGAPWALL